MESAKEVRDIAPSQMSYSFGKPLTEEEFRQLKAKDPNVRTISVPLESNVDLHAKLRDKIREKSQARQRISNE